MKNILLLLLCLCSLQVCAQHDVPPTSSFTVSGMVKKEFKFSADNLAGYRQDSIGEFVVRNRKGEKKGVSEGLNGILLKSVIDSAGIEVEKPKEYSKLIIVLTASDGYVSVFSWNELFNTDIGNHVYIITQMDGQLMPRMKDRVLVLSLADTNPGSRHLKGLTKVEVRKID